MCRGRQLSIERNGVEVAEWAQVSDVDSIDTSEDGRGVYMWLRLADGRGAHWQFEFGLPPGQDQRIRVIEGA